MTGSKQTNLSGWWLWRKECVSTIGRQPSVIVLTAITLPRLDRLHVEIVTHAIRDSIAIFASLNALFRQSLDLRTAIWSQIMKPAGHLPI